MTAGSQSAKRQLVPEAKTKAVDGLDPDAKLRHPSVTTGPSKAEAAMACPPIAKEAWETKAWLAIEALQVTLCGSTYSV